MWRREFLALLGGASAAWPFAARAQQNQTPLVGVLRINAEGSNEAFAEPFRRDMKTLGWDEGRNIRYRFAWAGGQNERLPALAQELVAQKVDVLIAFGTPSVNAAGRATSTIPIIAMADDMIASGLATNLRRMQSSNMTGVSILSTELDVKELELLHEFIPNAGRIGVLADPTVAPQLSDLNVAARTMGVELVLSEARNRDEIVRAIDAMIAARVEAVNILASPALSAARDSRSPNLNKRVCRRCISGRKPPKRRLSGLWPSPTGGVQAGANLADKIFRGANPADLPVEQPSKFDLVLNLKTAGKLGLNLSPLLLLRADDVIE